MLKYNDPTARGFGTFMANDDHLKKSFLMATKPASHFQFLSVTLNSENALEWANKALFFGVTSRETSG